MRREILEALKAKFTGVSDAILGRIADKLAKTTTTAEQVQAAVEAYTWQQLIEGYGDSRATEAQQTAVQNYETKYGLKDGVKANGGTGGAPVVQTPPPAGGAEAVPAWAQALIDSNKSLTDRLNKMDGERTTATRKQQLSAIIDKLPEDLRKGYSRISVDTLTDEEFNTLVGEITTEVDGIVKATQQRGAVFKTPSVQGGTGNKGGELTKEQEAAISQREGALKEGEQPF